MSDAAQTKTGRAGPRRGAGPVADVRNFRRAELLANAVEDATCSSCFTAGTTLSNLSRTGTSSWGGPWNASPGTLAWHAREDEDITTSGACGGMQMLPGLDSYGHQDDSVQRGVGDSEEAPTSASPTHPTADYGPSPSPILQQPSSIMPLSIPRPRRLQRLYIARLDPPPPTAAPSPLHPCSSGSTTSESHSSKRLTPVNLRVGSMSGSLRILTRAGSISSVAAAAAAAAASTACSSTGGHPQLHQEQHPSKHTEQQQQQQQQQQRQQQNNYLGVESMMDDEHECSMTVAADLLVSDAGMAVAAAAAAAAEEEAPLALQCAGAGAGLLSSHAGGDADDMVSPAAAAATAAAAVAAESLASFSALRNATEPKLHTTVLRPQHHYASSAPPSPLLAVVLAAAVTSKPASARASPAPSPLPDTTSVKSAPRDPADTTGAPGSFSSHSSTSAPNSASRHPACPTPSSTCRVSMKLKSSHVEQIKPGALTALARLLLPQGWALSGVAVRRGCVELTLDFCRLERSSEEGGTEAAGDGDGDSALGAHARVAAAVATAMMGGKEDGAIMDWQVAELVACLHRQGLVDPVAEPGVTVQVNRQMHYVEWQEPDMAASGPAQGPVGATHERQQRLVAGVGNIAGGPTSATAHGFVATASPVAGLHAPSTASPPEGTAAAALAPPGGSTAANMGNTGGGSGNSDGDGDWDSAYGLGKGAWQCSSNPPFYSRAPGVGLAVEPSCLAAFGAAAPCATSGGAGTAAAAAVTAGEAWGAASDVAGDTVLLYVGVPRAGTHSCSVRCLGRFLPVRELWRLPADQVAAAEAEATHAAPYPLDWACAAAAAAATGPGGQVMVIGVSAADLPAGSALLQVECRVPAEEATWSSVLSDGDVDAIADTVTAAGTREPPPPQQPLQQAGLPRGPDPFSAPTPVLLLRAGGGVDGGCGRALAHSNPWGDAWRREGVAGAASELCALRGILSHDAGMGADGGSAGEAAAEFLMDLGLLVDSAACLTAEAARGAAADRTAGAGGMQGCYDYPSFAQELRAVLLEQLGLAGDGSGGECGGGGGGGEGAAAMAVVAEAALKQHLADTAVTLLAGCAALSLPHVARLVLSLAATLRLGVSAEAAADGSGADGADTLLAAAAEGDAGVASRLHMLLLTREAPPSPLLAPSAFMVQRHSSSADGSGAGLPESVGLGPLAPAAAATALASVACASSPYYGRSYSLGVPQPGWESAARMGTAAPASAAVVIAAGGGGGGPFGVLDLAMSSNSDANVRTYGGQGVLGHRGREGPLGSPLQDVRGRVVSCPAVDSWAATASMPLSAGNIPPSEFGVPSFETAALSTAGVGYNSPARSNDGFASRSAGAAATWEATGNGVAANGASGSPVSPSQPPPHRQQQYPHPLPSPPRRYQRFTEAVLAAGAEGELAAASPGAEADEVFCPLADSAGTGRGPHLEQQQQEPADGPLERTPGSTTAPTHGSAADGNSRSPRLLAAAGAAVSTAVVPGSSLPAVPEAASGEGSRCSSSGASQQHEMEEQAVDGEHGVEREPDTAAQAPKQHEDHNSHQPQYHRGRALLRSFGTQALVSLTGFSSPSQERAFWVDTAGRLQGACRLYALFTLAFVFLSSLRAFVEDGAGTAAFMLLYQGGQAALLGCYGVWGGGEPSPYFGAIVAAAVLRALCHALLGSGLAPLPSFVLPVCRAWGDVLNECVAKPVLEQLPMWLFLTLTLLLEGPVVYLLYLQLDGHGAGLLTVHIGLRLFWFLALKITTAFCTQAVRRMRFLAAAAAAAVHRAKAE